MKGCFNGILLSVLLLGKPAQAQQLNLKSYSFNEGLKTYNIFKVLQDGHGFVWIATQDGLYRYNGKTFDVLKNYTANGSIAIGNAFLDAGMGPDQKIYVADYTEGIDVIETATLATKQVDAAARHRPGTRFTNYGIEKIYPDKYNTLWVAGSGFLAYKPADSTVFTFINNIEGLPASLTVNFLKPISATHLAAGINQYGLLVFNMQTRTLEKTITGLPGDIRDIIVDGDTVYAVTDKEISKGTFKNNNWTVIESFSHPAFRQCVASCLVKDKFNRLWIGTNQGLVMVDLASKTFSFIVSDNSGKNSLKDNNINHLFIDNQDNLWISTSKLLQMTSLSTPFFVPYNGLLPGNDPMEHIYTLAAKNEQELFATATDGLYSINLPAKTVRKINGSSAFGAIHHLEKIEPGFWIVSSDNGMLGFNPFTEELSQQLLLTRYPEWIPYKSNYFNTAYHHSQSFYWASEENEGLLKWTITEGTITKFKAGTASSHGLPENHIRNLKADREGKLWLLSDNTATQFDMEKDTALNVLKYTGDKNGFLANLLSDVYDAGNELWFCTYGGGINGYNKKNHTWQYITEREGLSNNCAYSILPENDSIFWVSTNMGLSRVNRYTKFCSNYFLEDGLQDNSFDEKGALAVGRKLYFGGINGFTELDIDKYRNILSDFPVYIHRVEYYVNGNKSVINNLDWKTLTLPAGTNPIIIYLSALTYSNSHKIKFSYKISGIHNEYIEVQGTNAITLNTLGYGDYTVTIRYTRENGAIAENILQLELYIAPKWYQTWWFKVLAVLLIVAIGYLLYRLRINQLKKEHQIRSKLAGDLHDDLGSTMNSVKVYANLAKMHKQEEYLTKVIESTQMAITGIRDIIWVLDDSRGNIDHLLSRITVFASPLCEANGMQYVQKTTYEAREYKLGQEEKRNLYMIFKEAVNNAVKYSQGKQVDITITLKKGKPVIQIHDDGVGFNIDTSGEGNGLKNMKRRSKQIKYHISIESATGNGTSITLLKI